MKKKIEIEKEFLDMILKKITDLEKKLEGDPTEIFSLPNMNQENYLFQCHALAPYSISPEKQPEFNTKVNEFGDELKILMKKYGFIRSSGEFLAKNIN